MTSDPDDVTVTGPDSAPGLTIEKSADVEQYAAVGISEFVLSGYPHLEESYWFGEGVLPELARRGLWSHPALSPAARVAVPFGTRP